MIPRRVQRRLCGVLLLAIGAVAACGKDVSSDAGEVNLSAWESEAVQAVAHPVEFELGESRLEQLLTARERLASVKAPEASRALELDVRRAGLDGTDRPIAGIVEDLQQDADTRRAIEGSGLSVRDFVSGIFAVQQAVLARGIQGRSELSPLLLANMEVVTRNVDRVAQLASGTSFASVVEESGRLAASRQPGFDDGDSARGGADGATFGPARARSGTPIRSSPGVEDNGRVYEGGRRDDDDGDSDKDREKDRRKDEKKKDKGKGRD